MQHLAAVRTETRRNLVLWQSDVSESFIRRPVVRLADLSAKGLQLLLWAGSRAACESKSAITAIYNA